MPDGGAYLPSLPPPVILRAFNKPNAASEFNRVIYALDRPIGKDTATDTLEKRLWDSADQLRANSGLKAQEYSGRHRLRAGLRNNSANAELPVI